MYLIAALAVAFSADQMAVVFIAITPRRAITSELARSMSVPFSFLG